MWNDSLLSFAVWYWCNRECYISGFCLIPFFFYIFWWLFLLSCRTYYCGGNGIAIKLDVVLDCSSLDFWISHSITQHIQPDMSEMGDSGCGYSGFQVQKQVTSYCGQDQESSSIGILWSDNCLNSVQTNLCLFCSANSNLTAPQNRPKEKKQWFSLH